MLANAIEVRDVYTLGHVERVVAYAMLLAAEMGFQGRLLDQLRLGAILHDIGKIIIRGAILFKEKPLTDEDWQVLRTHASAGADMIRDIEYLAPVIPSIRHHHERWDGQGYPDRLAGDEIPLPARIISVADSFDAMTTRKPYRDAKSQKQAFEEILQLSGTRYDPEVVEAFERVWQAGKIQSIIVEWEELIQQDSSTDPR
jgi:putative nucleotidyltransferase with HDIG domain